tara:strand:- start:38912 stop:39685 length:774 start_codon:yes stop_codon:yes gene_type:complete
MSTKTIKTSSKPKKVLVDKTYKLTRDMAPLAFMLSSKHTRRKPLLYFDELEGVNKPMRYARNQKSPFEEEQDGNAILEPIIFQDGFLSVSRTNPVLQEFLHYHPDNGGVFVEVNLEADASEELEIMNHEVDALIEARNLDVTRLEQVARVVLGKQVENMTTAELKRDVLVFARKHPIEFLDVLNDPMLTLQAKVNGFFSDNLLVVKRNQIYFNTPTNKKKMLTVPFGESRDHIVSSFLQSDDGIEALKILEHLTEKV